MRFKIKIIVLSTFLMLLFSFPTFVVPFYGSHEINIVRAPGDYTPINESYDIVTTDDVADYVSIVPPTCTASGTRPQLYTRLENQ